MKKYYFLIILALILGLILTGCLSNVGQVPTSEQSGISYLVKNGIVPEPPVGTIPVALLAGQTLEVGEVYIWNDIDNLYVKYVITDSDWCLIETHVHVGEELADFPLAGKQGNPVPGQFDYSDPHGCVPYYTYNIPLGDWAGGCDELMIAAHAVVQKATRVDDILVFESEIGTSVFGPIYEVPDLGSNWGDEGAAVRAYNWMGYTRDLSDPDQIPGCLTNPAVSTTWSWGFGNVFNPTYNPDIDDVIWISTAPNTEIWHVDSWRKFAQNFNVPGTPISGSIMVNADNYYLVSNGGEIGSDDNIFNGPETYSFLPVEGTNSLEFIVKNLASGSAGDYCAQLGNPNGLTFKGEVDYYYYKYETETAWADGTRFTLKGNWATYFYYTVGYNMVGTWIMDFVWDGSSYGRFIIIDTQVDGEISGSFGVYSPPSTYNIYGTIDGTIDCLSVDMFYTNTVDPPYTAEFSGTMSSDGESVSGEWEDSDGNDGTWTATRQ